jgi:hypothetical protein
MRDIVDLIRAEDPTVYIRNIMIGKKAHIFFSFSLYLTEENTRYPTCRMSAMSRTGIPVELSNSKGKVYDTVQKKQDKIIKLCMKITLKSNRNFLHIL